MGGRDVVISLFVNITSRITGLTSSVLVVALLSAPAQVAARTVLDANSIGISDVLPFRDRTDEIGLSIPVPAGLTPRTLAATVQTPVDLASGNLEAWSGDLLLARIPIDGSEEFIRVEVPLERAEVRDEVAAVTLRTVLASGGLACPDWTERSLELRDAEVIYDGDPEMPRVLADFIPPVLETLEIYLPDTPTSVEAEAAAELATISSARPGSVIGGWRSRSSGPQPSARRRPPRSPAGWKSAKARTPGSICSTRRCRPSRSPVTQRP